MKPVSMSFETGFIALRKYLRWPTQLLALAYVPKPEKLSGRLSNW